MTLYTLLYSIDINFETVNKCESMLSSRDLKHPCSDTEDLTIDVNLEITVLFTAQNRS